MSENLHLNLIISFNYDFCLFRGSSRKSFGGWLGFMLIFIVFLLLRLFCNIFQSFWANRRLQTGTSRGWRRVEASSLTRKKLQLSLTFMKRKIFAQQNLISPCNLFIIDFFGSSRNMPHSC